MLELPEPKSDGLPEAPAGPWSRDKHFYLARYLDGFTTAMKKKKWTGLHYIDLFAGPGILKDRESGKLEWGSPMIAAHCPLLAGIHVCDENKENLSALRQRLETVRPAEEIRAIDGDANEKAKEIIDGVPQRTLSLAFLDPYGADVAFDTIKTLSQRRMDLIVFFPDYVDMLRNWRDIYHDQTDSKLDRFLGTGSDWRREVNEHQSPRKRSEVFRSVYISQMKKLDYRNYGNERISAHGKPLYMLMFFSRSDVAGKIWRGISKKKPDGQHTFGY